MAGKHVWLAHPWALANMPDDLPADVMCIAVVFAEHLQAHPWSKMRWSFVGARMMALAASRWFGSTTEILAALTHAESVTTVGHLCLPDLSGSSIDVRPAPRLFRHVEKPMDSFSKWWVQVNKNVRHLQQLVYPLPTRKTPS